MEQNPGILRNTSVFRECFLKLRIKAHPHASIIGVRACHGLQKILAVPVQNKPSVNFVLNTVYMLYSDICKTFP